MYRPAGRNHRAGRTTDRAADSGRKPVVQQRIHRLYIQIGRRVNQPEGFPAIKIIRNQEIAAVFHIVEGGHQPAVNHIAGHEEILFGYPLPPQPADLLPAGRRHFIRIPGFPAEQPGRVSRPFKVLPAEGIVDQPLLQQPGVQRRRSAHKQLQQHVRRRQLLSGTVIRPRPGHLYP